MNNDIISNFKSSEELRNYARINGFDGGMIDILIAKWELLQLEAPSQEPATIVDSEEEV